MGAGAGWPPSHLAMEPFSYDLTPEGYACTKCHASGCKLWRQYQVFVSGVDLLCAECAVLDQKAKFIYVDGIGLDAKGQYEGRYGITDQIGMLVPAVPTEDGETFWGYTSIPEEGVAWWRRLPTYPREKR